MKVIEENTMYFSEEYINKYEFNIGQKVWFDDDEEPFIVIGKTRKRIRLRNSKSSKILRFEDNKYVYNFEDTKPVRITGISEADKPEVLTDFERQVINPSVKIITITKTMLSWNNTEKGRDFKDCYERVTSGERVVGYRNTYNTSEFIYSDHKFFKTLEKMYKKNYLKAKTIIQTT